MLPSGKSKSTNGRTPLEWGSLSSWGPSRKLKKNSGWAAACWPAWRTLASLSGCVRLLFNLCTTLRTLPHSLSGRGRIRRSGPPCAGRLILTAILRRMPPSGCNLTFLILAVAFSIADGSVSHGTKPPYDFLKLPFTGIYDA